MNNACKSLNFIIQILLFFLFYRKWYVTIFLGTAVGRPLKELFGYGNGKIPYCFNDEKYEWKISKNIEPLKKHQRVL